MQSLSPNSAYHQTKVIRDWNDVERFIEWTPPKYGNVPERLYVVTITDVDRIDNISYRMYDTSEKWWVILDHNLVHDPFSLEQGDQLRIPIWDWDRFNAIPVVNRFVEEVAPPLLPMVPYIPPPYQRPDTPREETPFVDSLIYTFGLSIPECVNGVAHFQLQVSDAGAFTNILLNRMTQTAQERWFFYDPFLSNGAGGFRAFPSSGIDGSVYSGQAVYFQIKESDGLAHGVQYYPRWRVFIDNVESPWVSAPPFVAH